MRRRGLGVELRPAQLLPGRPPLVLPLARPEGWGGGAAGRRGGGAAGREGRTRKGPQPSCPCPSWLSFTQTW